MLIKYVVTIDKKLYQIDGGVWLKSPEMLVYGCSEVRSGVHGYTAYSPMLKRFCPVRKNQGDAAVAALVMEYEQNKR